MRVGCIPQKTSSTHIKIYNNKLNFRLIRSLWVYFLFFFSHKYVLITEVNVKILKYHWALGLDSSASGKYPEVKIFFQNSWEVGVTPYEWSLEAVSIVPDTIQTHTNTPIWKKSPCEKPFWLLVPEKIEVQKDIRDEIFFHSTSDSTVQVPCFSYVGSFGCSEEAAWSLEDWCTSSGLPALSDLWCLLRAGTGLLVPHTCLPWKIIFHTGQGIKHELTSRQDT